jgi:hypothetical protein
VADIFLSYSREDAAIATAQLFSALSTRGFSVWWDGNIAAGSNYGYEIAGALQSARVVLSIWSNAAADPKGWVYSESIYARDNYKSILPLTVTGFIPNRILPPFNVLHALPIEDTGKICAWLAAEGIIAETLAEPVAEPNDRSDEIWEFIKEREERQLFLDFVSKYPESPRRQDAIARLTQLGNTARTWPGANAKEEVQPPRAEPPRDVRPLGPGRPQSPRPDSPDRPSLDQIERLIEVANTTPSQYLNARRPSLLLRLTVFTVIGAFLVNILTDFSQRFVLPTPLSTAMRRRPLPS